MKRLLFLSLLVLSFAVPAQAVLLSQSFTAQRFVSSRIIIMPTFTLPHWWTISPQALAELEESGSFDVSGNGRRLFGPFETAEGDVGFGGSDDSNIEFFLADFVTQSIGLEGPFSITRVNQSRLLRGQAPGHLGSTEEGAGNPLALEVYYQSWDAAGIDGDTWGFVPSYSFGGDVEITLSAPINRMEADASEATEVHHAGVDLSARTDILEGRGQVGAHAFIAGQFDDDWDNSIRIAGGGPFVSADWTLQGLSIGLSALLGLSEVENDDLKTELIPQLDIALPVGNWVVHGFAALYQDLDAPDGVDENYWDLGTDLQMNSPLGICSLGVSTIQDSDVFEGVEIFLRLVNEL